MELQMPAGTATVIVPDDSPLVAKYRANGWTVVDEPEAAPEPKAKAAPARKSSTHR